MKKLLLPILAIFMAFTAVACTGSEIKALTAQEYIDQLKVAFSAYSDYSKEYSEKFETDIEAAKVSIQSCRTTLDKIAELVPPEKYKDLYDKFKQGIEEEKKYLDMVEEFYNYSIKGDDMNVEETDKATALVEEMNKYADSSTFLTAFSDLVKAVREELQ